MKKKNKKTFAQRAKEIQNKYKRVEFDPIEKADMEAELESLMTEQEQVRESMGLNQQEQPQMPQQQFAVGGPLGLGTLSPEMLAQFQANTPMGTDLDASVQSNVPQTPTELSPMKTLSSQEISGLNQDADKAQSFGFNLRKGVQGLGDNPNLPYALSGASNIASNLLLASLAKKNKASYSPTLGIPEKINLEPQAEQLRKDATVAKNVAMRNARNLGTNASATLANMGAIGADIDRGLGANLTNLYMGQESANVGAANQFNMANLDASNRAGMFNEQSKLQSNADRLGYLSGALGTLPSVMKDIRMDKADKEMRGIMDRYYQSVGGKNYAVPGSLFTDPETNFKYRVKPDLTLEKVD